MNGNGLNIFDAPAAATGQNAAGAQTGSLTTAERAASRTARAQSESRRASTAIPDEQLVSLTSPRSFEAEQYRTLCQIIESRRRSSKLQVIAVSSAGIGDGKTTTTLNLAGALAQTHGSRVLLIDGDLRCPAVAAQLRLGGPNRPGLAGAIRDHAVGLSAAIHRLPEWNLSVLATGVVDDSPYEMLKSGAFARIIDEARTDFEFVLIDCPPLLAVPDCRVIERVVDGFLLVVSADSTTIGVARPSRTRS